MTRIKNADQSREERDFIFIENEHFCDASAAYPLSEIRRLAKLCSKVSISAASRSCFPPPPPIINVGKLGRGRGSIAPGAHATSPNIDFGGRGGKQHRDACRYDEYVDAGEAGRRSRRPPRGAVRASGPEVQHKMQTCALQGGVLCRNCTILMCF